MKKIIVSISTITVLVFTGCFIDSDTATVRINLGNIPVTKVEKKSMIDRIVMLFVKEAVAMDDNPPETGLSVVHIGAFDSNNKLLTKKTILLSDYLIIYNNDNIVEFLVPARSAVTIVVLGEGDYYGEEKIKYYGKNITPLNLVAGQTINIGIQMSQEFVVFLPQVGYRREWERVIGASSYKVYDWDNELYSGQDNYYEGSSNYYYLEVNFAFAGNVSEKIQFEISS